MKSFSAIIDAFGYARLAAHLGRPDGTVSSWKTRNFIPPEFWPAIVARADELHIAGVTYEGLARLAAERAALATEGAAA